MVHRLLAFVLLVLSPAILADKPTLRFLTWENYISPEIVEAFEKDFNVKVEFVYFLFDTTSIHAEKAVQLALSK